MCNPEERPSNITQVRMRFPCPPGAIIGHGGRKNGVSFFSEWGGPLAHTYSLQKLPLSPCFGLQSQLTASTKTIVVLSSRKSHHVSMISSYSRSVTHSQCKQYTACLHSCFMFYSNIAYHCLHFKFASGHSSETSSYLLTEVLSTIHGCCFSSEVVGRIEVSRWKHNESSECKGGGMESAAGMGGGPSLETIVLSRANTANCG